ncbi:hypothetical protein L0F63_004345 [Massospora cicadina]|nr:hypothetical protein L0F63_004345 [Massospora cicadina]
MDQGCKNIVTRPEVRSLSSRQLNAFFNAVRGLRNLNNSDVFNQHSAIHYNNSPQAHGVPAFFPWHREYLRRYELALQRVDPSVVLPYWDWSIDSQAPELSPILTNTYFGGNGRSSDSCVVQGNFARWNVPIPNPHCLRRRYNRGDRISAFYSPESLEAIISQATTYDQLCTSIEGGPHGAVHTGIGGSTGDFSQMYSSNDPLFYVHHAFIDLLWNEWQMRNPSLANTYNGGSASTSNIMRPFNVPVSQVLNTKAAGYCYTYPRYGVNLPVSPPASSNSTSPPISTSASTLIPTTTTQPITTQTPIQTNPTTTQIPQPTNFQGHFFPTNNFFGRGHPLFGHKPFHHRGKFRSLFRRHTKLNAGITNLYAKLYNKVKRLIVIPSTDRSTPHKIRTPEPLPQAYLLSNHLNVDKVRSDEEALAGIVESLNAIPGFVPYADI